MRSFGLCLAAAVGLSAIGWNLMTIAHRVLRSFDLSWIIN